LLEQARSLKDTVKEKKCCILRSWAWLGGTGERRNGGAMSALIPLLGLYLTKDIGQGPFTNVLLSITDNLRQSPNTKGSRHKPGRSPDSCPGGNHKENGNVKKKVRGSPFLGQERGKDKPESSREGHQYRGGRFGDWAFGKVGVRVQGTLRGRG
jgi:hypothetical protein